MKRVLRAAAALAIGAALLPAMVTPGTAMSERRIYFVLLDGAPLAVSVPGSGPAALRGAMSAQEPVIAAARALGGEVRYRYTRTLNGFSALLTSEAAASLRGAQGVARIEPVGVVERALDDSVSLIGAPKVWAEHGKKGRGKGVHVAVIDTGVDYTHAAFGGEGTPAAYNANNPNVIAGDFPTGKVVAGYDFVGDDYDVLDNKTNNDTPQPDPDPLDPHGHGTHVAHTCCGKRVAGIGRGVAPKAKIHAYKVWGRGGSSTADVLVAAYELAADPNEDGSLADHVDVVNFSGGVYYGDSTTAEALAAQALVDAGVVFVAAAGNSSGRAYRVGTPATAPGVLAVAASQVSQERLAGFSSAGPARGGAMLKPEITAPGDPIYAAAAGSGSGGAFLSGTSMASPHVAGAAAAIVALHPDWTPPMVKAALMNHARRRVRDGGVEPAPAHMMGAGRIRVAPSADAVSLALPGALSFGVVNASQETTLSRSFTVMNRDTRRHRYEIEVKHSFTNLHREAAEMLLVHDDDPPSEVLSFWLEPGEQRNVEADLTIEPGLIPPTGRQLARDGILPTFDGFFKIKQRRNGKDTLKVPWFAVAHARSSIGLNEPPPDLSSGSDTISFDVTPTAADPAAEIYSLGVADPTGEVSIGEADIVYVGARSFAGDSLGDGPEGLPDAVDPYGDEWLESLGVPGLEEPLEFVIVTDEPHDTIETLDVKIEIDLGADGVFADGTGADVLIRKRPLSTEGCVRDLRVPASDCEGPVGVDHDLLDTPIVGLVVDAFDIGLAEGDSAFSYRVTVCSDLFSGDVEQPVCDSTKGHGGDTYPATFDATEQEPVLERSFCDGFYSATDCRDGIEVVGSPGDPDLLIVFPNNPSATIVDL